MDNYYDVGEIRTWVSGASGVRDRVGHLSEKRKRALHSRRKPYPGFKLPVDILELSKKEKNGNS